MQRLNVASAVLKWFQSYLSGRIHRVKSSLIGNQCWVVFHKEVPLGPLLFLTYMNKLPLQVTNGLLVQHADNTILICCGPIPAVAVPLMNLQLVSSFISDSRNFNKSNVMWFWVCRKKQADCPPITIGKTA